MNPSHDLYARYVQSGVPISRQLDPVSYFTKPLEHIEVPFVVCDTKDITGHVRGAMRQIDGEPPIQNVYESISCSNRDISQEPQRAKATGNPTRVCCSQKAEHSNKAYS